METPLAEMFVAYAGAKSEVDLERLEAMLQRILANAREAWPDVTVSVDAFIPYLGARAARGPAGLRPLDLEQTLAALHTKDLYLACACASNDRCAIAHFETRHLGAVDHAIARLDMPLWVADEVKQFLRCSFFVVEEGLDGRGTSIDDYSGRGPLRAFVAAAAVHAGFAIVRRPKNRAEMDSAVMEAVRAPGDDVELEYLKRRYSGELEEALRTVYASLSPRERNVLRSYHAEGSGIDGVAALHGIHRVTASRWVKRITEDFLAETRRVLMARLHADRSEISSVLRLIQSRINATLRAAIARSSSDPAR